MPESDDTQDRLVSFIVTVPLNGDWDYDDVREQIGNGQARLYKDEPVPTSADDR